LEAPFAETQDADGDGFEEVFVELQPASGEPPCIRVYRVRDSGFVDLVEDANYTLARSADAQSNAWRDPTFCAAAQQGDESSSRSGQAESSEATKSTAETK